MYKDRLRILILDLKAQTALILYERLMSTHSPSSFAKKLLTRSGEPGPVAAGRITLL